MEAASFVSKPVQELLVNDDQLPERYVYGGTIDAILPSAEIPVVDLSILSSSVPSKKEELAKLSSAHFSWGYFQATNHGMTSAFLVELRGIAKEFFALPKEEKQKYCRSAVGSDGYGNDDFVSKNETMLDWNDRLYLTVRPVCEIKLKFWPENFREMVREFALKSEQIIDLLLEIMARLLNLEDQTFLEQYGEEPIMDTTFNFYPKCPRPNRAIGFRPHADGSVITILLQDEEVAGLQVLNVN